MTAPETRAVVAALTAGGAAARFVGGCVRDAILGRPAGDVDLATPEAPEEVMRRLQAAGIRAIPTGIEHGTVTAVVGRSHFEITTLRRDVETDGRRARVAFTDDWTEDAARRDFTINALSAEPDGTLHDPFGGEADLRAGRVRFVGDPETRIREDVLRLLRFFRFHAHYGHGEPDAAALAACRRLAHLLPGLSGERIAGEVIRLLRAPDPAPVVRLMLADGIFAPVLPELGGAERLAALVAIEREVDAPNALRRLACLLPDDTAAAAVGQRLRLSNAQVERLVALTAPAHAISLEAARPTRRRLQRRLGTAAAAERVLLTWAEARARGEAVDAAFAALLAEVRGWSPPEFPLRGRDVLALGVAPGAGVGRLLAEVESWWEEGDYRADRAACLARLRELASAR